MFTSLYLLKILAFTTNLPIFIATIMKILKPESKVDKLLLSKERKKKIEKEKREKFTLLLRQNKYSWKLVIQSDMPDCLHHILPLPFLKSAVLKMWSQVPCCRSLIAPSQVIKLTIHQASWDTKTEPAQLIYQSYLGNYQFDSSLVAYQVSIILTCMPRTYVINML